MKIIFYFDHFFLHNFIQAAVNFISYKYSYIINKNSIVTVTAILGKWLPLNIVENDTIINQKNAIKVGLIGRAMSLCRNVCMCIEVYFKNKSTNWYVELLLLWCFIVFTYLWQEIILYIKMYNSMTWAFILVPFICNKRTSSK